MASHPSLWKFIPVMEVAGWTARQQNYVTWSGGQESAATPSRFGFFLSLGWICVLGLSMKHEYKFPSSMMDLLCTAKTHSAGFAFTNVVWRWIRNVQHLVEKMEMQLMKNIENGGLSLFSTLHLSNMMSWVAYWFSCFFVVVIALLIAFYPLPLQIIWENQKVGDYGNDCLISVDGTDCAIPYQQVEPKAWYTKKFNAGGLQYEIGVCILTGWIV